MKKTLIALMVVATIATASALTGCGPSTPKEDAAQTKVDEAQQDLNDAQRAATAEEWQAFKDETDIKIKENELRIAELKVKMKKSGKAIDAIYEKKIDDLEQQNMDMKARVEAYEQTGKTEWEAFKQEFNHDMDELGNALKDLTVDNKN
jgi:outer membrane murein-binding lipoprotein Lpp